MRVEIQITCHKPSGATTFDMTHVEAPETGITKEWLNEIANNLAKDKGGKLALDRRILFSGTIEPS